MINGKCKSLEAKQCRFKTCSKRLLCFFLDNLLYSQQGTQKVTNELRTELNLVFIVE
jgi:hypothetical protein